MKIKVVSIALLLVASPALAETQADRDAISSGMDNLIAAVEAGDFAKTLDTLPPKMLEEMASRAGMSAEDMRVAATATADTLMDQVKIESFDYQIDEADFGKTDAREYALIPTNSVMESMDRKVKVTGDTLALQENGEWYLVRIEDESQLEMLGAAYPDMAEVEIAASKVELME